MWGNFLEKGRELAEKAKAAAADLDKQINETVGIDSSVAIAPSREDSALSHDDDNDVLTDDAWADDFQLDSPREPEKPVITASEASTCDEIPNLLVGQTASSPTEEQPLEEAAAAVVDDSAMIGNDDIQAHVDIDGNDDEDDVENQGNLMQESTVSPLLPENPSLAEDVNGAQDPYENQKEQRPPPSHEETIPVEPTDVSPRSEEEEVISSPFDQGLAENHSPAPQTSLVELDEGLENDQISQVDQEEALDKSQSIHEETSMSITVAHDEPEDISRNASPFSLVDQADKNFVEHEQSNSISDAVEVERILVDDDPPQQPPPSVHTQAFQQELESQKELNRLLQQQILELSEHLEQREEQLFSKTEQLTTMQSMYEAEKIELEQKVQRTKEEAKKRIQKAKERVDAIEEQFKKQQNATMGDAAQQAEIIAALREEGESLARKQAEMEKAVRNAKAETRELKEVVETISTAKEEALMKIERLESELKVTKDNLSVARQGESLASKLEAELLREREESARKSASILSLEQSIKELKSKIKDLHSELEAAKTGALLESEREQKKIQKQSTEIIEDLENKLRTSEREAAIREDALRLEVSELRKRWQDAVRRADALSMDAQSSTAPLLRQLESMERQNRARAAAWGDLETKLRTELEETVITNEKLSRERGDWKTKYSRLERTAKEHEDELKLLKVELEQRTRAMKIVEEKLEKLEAEAAKKKEEYSEIERLANEGVARVRSEMSQRAVESEERHRSQLDALEAELRQERDKKVQLERQVHDLVENAGVIVPPAPGSNTISVMRMNAKPKKLVQSQDQAQILAGALTGLDINDGDDLSDAESEEYGLPTTSGAGSFAALEELTSRLKVSKVELEALRKSLKESELSREKLVEELAESRGAKEKLPLFEERVKELTTETNEQQLEIRALRDDIAEVRELYRTQLNVLLEEKAALATRVDTESNGDVLKADIDSPEES